MVASLPDAPSSSSFYWSTTPGRLPTGNASLARPLLRPGGEDVEFEEAHAVLACLAGLAGRSLRRRRWPD